jgi:hypothetical protein
MSRGDGFPNADMDTEYFRDPNVRRLIREYPVAIWSQGIIGHWGLILACWACGKRLPAADGWPDVVPLADEVISALQVVNLLDKSTRLPAATWRRWYGAAAERREKRRFAGSIGGKHKASNARASLQQTPSDALPVPSVPAVPIDSPKPPQVGAVGKKRRANGTSPRANGDAPRQREEAVKAGLLAAFKEIGGVKSMPPGLKDEGEPEPDAMDTDYIGGGS